MSDPAQKPTNPAQSAPRRDQTGWFALSVLLHLAAAAALVFFTPIREVFLEPAAAGGPAADSPTSLRFSEAAVRWAVREVRLSSLRTSSRSVLRT